MSSLERKLEANRKITELYPFGIASARVARYELLKDPSTTTARRMHDRYMEDISKNITYFTGRDGLSHFIPSTYLNTAYFLIEAEKYGVSDTEEVRKSFDSAYSTAVSSQNNTTAEFTLLSYANYLLSKDLKPEAESVLTKLAAINTSKMVKMSTEGGLADYKSLSTYLKSGTDLAKQIKSKYN
jgi:hypothetical protein